MATKFDLTSTYAEVAANAAAVTIVQCIGNPGGYSNAAEIVASAAAPATNVVGLQIPAGQQLLAAQITLLGAGKLWARTAWGNTKTRIVLI